MTKGLCKLLWLRKFLTKIGFTPSSEMNIFCNNKTAINISHNPIQHDRTMHIEVDGAFRQTKSRRKKLFGLHLLNQKASWRTYLQRKCPTIILLTQQVTH